MTELNDRRRRDLAGLADLWRAYTWVFGLAFLVVTVGFGVRFLWGVLRFVVPGGVQ